MLSILKILRVENIFRAIQISLNNLSQERGARRLFFYTAVLSLVIGTNSVLAQNAATSPNSTVELKEHLLPGAEIFDASGKWVGLVTQVNDNGSIVIREIAASPVPNTASLRVLPAGSVSWQWGQLKASLSAEDIVKLPGE